MDSVLIIGAGAAGSVVAQKCALNRDVFKKIHLASRRIESCEKIRAEVKTPIEISQVDADQVGQVVALIRKVRPDLVINMALPYQDLPIMDACLETGVHYMDTANYEPREEAKFSYSWQWPYHERFAAKGIMAILGCGFDPGQSNIYCAYAQEFLFDTIDSIDIVDCNDGSHGKAFATNFNPEINLREVTQRGKYWKAGQWIEIDPLSIACMVDYPEVGPRKSYLIYHEEEESLVIDQVALARADLGIVDHAGDRQRIDLDPLALLPVLAALGDLAQVDLGIEVGGERLAVAAVVAVDDVDLVDLVEQELLRVGAINVRLARIEAAAQDRHDPLLGELLMIRPLILVGELGLVARLVVGGVHVVHAGLQARIHDGEILIRQRHVDDQVGLDLLDQRDRFLDVVGVDL